MDEWFDAKFKGEGACLSTSLLVQPMTPMISYQSPAPIGLNMAPVYVTYPGVHTTTTASDVI